MFPSPYGVVCFNLVAIDNIMKKDESTFPSPYGVVCFNPRVSRSVEYVENVTFPSPYGVVCFNPLSPRILIFHHLQRLLRCRR